MSTNDETLIEALRTAGHDTAADALRDKVLAGQLRAAGREDLADRLDGNAPTQPEPEPTADDLLLAEMKAKNRDQWSTTGSASRE